MNSSDVALWQVTFIGIALGSLAAVLFKPKFKWLKSDLRVVRGLPPIHKDRMLIGETLWDLAFLSVIWIWSGLPASFCTLMTYFIVIQWTNHNCFAYKDGVKKIREWRGFRHAWREAKKAARRDAREKVHR